MRRRAAAGSTTWVRHRSTSRLTSSHTRCRLQSMSWAARPLAPAIRTVPRCCSCARPPPAKAPRRAYSTPPTFDDQVIQAAQKVLHDAQTNLEQGSVEAAKRNRELDGVRRALQDVEDGQEVRSSLSTPILWSFV